MLTVCNVNEEWAAHSGFETQRRCHQKSETGASVAPKMDMSHFVYACKMWCLLNLLLESWEYLLFYLTFWIAILDCGWKLHKLSIHTLVMLQK